MKPLPFLLVLALAAPTFAQDGTETRAQAEAKAAALVRRIDTNGDGAISRDEMAAFAAARTGETVVPGAPLPPAAAAMFSDADGNGDGRVTRAEAIAASLRGFDQADANHDGKVTPAERAAIAAGVAADLPAPAGPREVSGPPAPQP